MIVELQLEVSDDKVDITDVLGIRLKGEVLGLKLYLILFDFVLKLLSFIGILFQLAILNLNNLFILLGNGAYAIFLLIEQVSFSSELVYYLLVINDLYVQLVYYLNSLLELTDVLLVYALGMQALVLYPLS